ncbi:hypothetical protein DL769_009794 [Monosporascus sp. CRB-8-3]|nr:hypothetical protein DL769_009794 [Monosporascus sp. CRB-8-3]
MDNSQQISGGTGHSRNKSGARSSRPRSSTKRPLGADEAPPLSPQVAARLSSSRQASPRPSSSLRRSPVGSPERPSTTSSSSHAATTMMTKDFSYLLKPEIYHQLSPLAVPAPFRNSPRQPAPETPIPELLAGGHFRAAAIAAVQALTGSGNPGVPVVNPTDHARIFQLLYTRLACLCLADATALAAQEARALEDMGSAFYYADAASGAPQHHLVPWELRVLGVRLQAIGFGDPRRAVTGYYDLALEARVGVREAARAHDHSAAELWKARLADLGVRVAGALIEMDDPAAAAEHLASLDRDEDEKRRRRAAGGGGDVDGGDGGKLAVSRALVWLHLGDVGAARRCVADGRAGSETAEKVVDALADMADGEYEGALGKWRALRAEMEESGVRDEMVGVNLAVCLLYVGRMEEGREILEGLVDAGLASHTLLFNLTTMYELATDRAKGLKMRLAERVAELEPSPHGWEKTNGDFKL